MSVDYQSALSSYDPDWQKSYSIYVRLGKGRRKRKQEITKPDLLQRLTNLWHSLDRRPPKGHMEWDINRAWREWYDREAEAILRADYPDRWHRLRESEDQQRAVRVGEVRRTRNEPQLF